MQYFSRSLRTEETRVEIKLQAQIDRMEIKKLIFKATECERTDSIHLSWDRVKWQAPVDTLMNTEVP
jgi:hypothetical protein